MMTGNLGGARRPDDIPDGHAVPTAAAIVRELTDPMPQDQIEGADAPPAIAPARLAAILGATQLVQQIEAISQRIDGFLDPLLEDMEQISDAELDAIIEALPRGFHRSEFRAHREDRQAARQRCKL